MERARSVYSSRARVASIASARNVPEARRALPDEIGSLIQSGFDVRQTLRPQLLLIASELSCWRVFERVRDSYDNLYGVQRFEIAIGDEISRPRVRCTKSRYML